MRRRSRAGGEPIKTRRRKAMTLKRGNAPKAVRRRSSSAAGQETKVARLTRERDEALQQQTATAEILRVISRRHPETCRRFSRRWRIGNAHLRGRQFGQSLAPRRTDKFRSAAIHVASPENREYLFELAPGCSACARRGSAVA